MKDIEKILNEAWNSINYYQGGSLQIGVDSILEWYVAYHSHSAKELAIVSRSPIYGIESSKSIIASCNKRNDGRFYISFQLVENAEKDVFMTMCANLIEYSADAKNEKEAIKKVASRYKQWRRLMEKRHSGILSDEKRRGLLGELFYLMKILQSGKGKKEALAGWVGPDGADQDFVYNGKWREIKSTDAASDKLTIHSLEQLGTKKDTGELIVYRIDRCAPETTGAMTLRKMVHIIGDILGDDPALVERYYEKLSTVGYIDMDIYEQYPYKYSRHEMYDVNETFPRITRMEIRAEVANCQYIISIPAINGWKRG